MSLILCSDLFDRPRLSDAWSPFDFIEPTFGVTPIRRRRFRPSADYCPYKRKDRGNLLCATNEKDHFEIQVDCEHFKPEEISVKMVDNSLVIEGKHEERLDSNGFVSRQFTRKFTIPKDVIAEKIESSLAADGTLSIRAPKKQPKAIKSSERVIPIQLTSDTTKSIDKEAATDTEVNETEE